MVVFVGTTVHMQSSPPLLISCLYSETSSLSCTPGLFGEGYTDSHFDVVIPHKIGCEASYPWLQSGISDDFKTDDVGRDILLGAGYFQKVTVYRDRVVGNMQHFVC